MGHWSLVTICGDACPLSCVSAEACFTSWPSVCVCCATLLLSQLVGPLVCRHDRVTREVGRVGLVGKGSGEQGILSGVVPVYLYCPAFNVSVSVGVYSGHACLQAAQPLSIPYLVPSAWAELSGACRQGVQQPTNMQPGTFCYR